MKKISASEKIKNKIDEIDGEIKAEQEKVAGMGFARIMLATKTRIKKIDELKAVKSRLDKIYNSVLADEKGTE